MITLKRNEIDHILVRPLLSYKGIWEVIIILQSGAVYYTNMDLWWEQYGVLWIWGNNIDQGEAKVNILPKIHKTHIAWHHRSIFALLYVKCLLFKHIGVWIHIFLDSL